MGDVMRVLVGLEEFEVIGAVERGGVHCGLSRLPAGRQQRVSHRYVRY